MHYIYERMSLTLGSRNLKNQNNTFSSRLIQDTFVVQCLASLLHNTQSQYVNASQQPFSHLY